MNPPKPQEHPAAFGAFSVGSVSAFIVYELKARFGVDLNVMEVAMVGPTVAAIYFFLFGKKAKS